jgi:hypothetical protein
MTEPFDQEFYRSSWHRVLPVGPHGIQPYIRPGGNPGMRAGALARRGLATIGGTALRRAVGFGCRVAADMAGRLEAFAPRGGTTP